MKDDEIQRNIALAFGNLRRRIREGPSSIPGAILMPTELLLEMMTPERLRLLRYVQAKGEVASIGGLARQLRRDETRVGRDVVALEAIGLLSIEREGKSKRIRAEKGPIVLQ